MSGMLSYEEITLLLSELKKALRAGVPPDVDAEANLVQGAVAWKGSPRQELHVLFSTLDLCSLSSPPRAWTASALDAIGARLLQDASVSAEQFERVHSLPLLEVLVSEAVRSGKNLLARRALRRLGQRVNELFLRSRLGPEFLSVRTTTGSLETAARLSFETVDRELAVLCAEAGRMKLLSSVLAGALPQDAGTAWSTDRRPEASSLLHTIRSPTVATIHDEVARLSSREELGSVTRNFIEPWRPLLWTEEPRPEPRSRVEDALWEVALLEPTLEWIGARMEANSALIYPFFGSDWWGFVFLAREGGEQGGASISISVSSMIVRQDDLRDSGLPDEGTVQAMFAGGYLPDFIRREINDTIALADCRIVSWQPERTRDVGAMAWGAWLAEDAPASPMQVTPSARLLHRGRLKGSPTTRPTVGFVGDPSIDLVGPWVEAIEWSLVFGDSAAFSLGPQATRPALLESLATTDVTVLSGHGVTGGPTGEIELQLADGCVTYADLFDADIRSEFVILSCCSAGRVGAGRVRDEMLGLSTALLAVGVRQVMAPTIPVADAGTAIVGALVARELAQGFDLHNALGRAATAVAAATDAGVRIALSSGESRLIDQVPWDPALLQAVRDTPTGRVLEAILEFVVFAT